MCSALSLCVAWSFGKWNGALGGFMLCVILKVIV